MQNVDVVALDKQIKDLLNSNIKEDSKTGLHHLLGNIFDELMEYDYCIVERPLRKRRK